MQKISFYDVSYLFPFYAAAPSAFLSKDARRGNSHPTVLLCVCICVDVCAAKETKIKTTLKLVGISDAARAEGKTDNKNLRAAVLRSQNGVNRR